MSNFLEITISFATEAYAKDGGESREINNWVYLKNKTEGVSKFKFLSDHEINEIHEIPDFKRKCTAFRRKIEGKGFYKEIMSFKDDNYDDCIIVNIEGGKEPQKLELPWEVINSDRLKGSLSIIRRFLTTQEEGEDCINLNGSKVFCSPVYEMSTKEVAKNDITDSILEEASSFYELLNLDNAAVLRLGGLNEYINQLHNKEFNIFHFSGHGDVGELKISDDILLTASKIKVNSDFIFLNSCKSGAQAKKQNSLCYDLIHQEKANIMIGVKGNVNTNYAFKFSLNFYENLKEKAKNNEEVNLFEVFNFSIRNSAIRQDDLFEYYPAFYQA